MNIQDILKDKAREAGGELEGLFDEFIDAGSPTKHSLRPIDEVAKKNVMPQHISLLTEVWKKNFMACFITDPTGLRTRDRYGVETISWECDYPHSDSTWPYSPEVLIQELEAAKCSDAEINMITHENVARFFDWDPFKHTPRDQATVGALRALATDVDVSETSKLEYKRRWAETHA